jgi:predicted nucleic acid-binding protein
VRVVLDTNILAYAEGVNGASKQAPALGLIQCLERDSSFVPVQVLGELFRVLTGKAGWRPSKARAAILTWCDAFPLIETSGAAMLSASELATMHHFSIWDAVVISAASEAGCRVLISEDLQNGFTWSGVTVVNPFASERHPLLAALLSSPPQ